MGRSWSSLEKSKPVAQLWFFLRNENDLGFGGKLLKDVFRGTLFLFLLLFLLLLLLLLLLFLLLLLLLLFLLLLLLLCLPVYIGKMENANEVQNAVSRRRADIAGALWARIIKNPDLSTWPLAR